MLFNQLTPQLVEETPPILSSFVLRKFIALLMKEGKKIKAEKILKSVFIKISLKKLSPAKVLTLAVNNVKPLVEVRSVRRRGKSFQVPFPLTSSRQLRLSIKMILKSCINKKNFEDTLVEELLASSTGRSQSVKLNLASQKTAIQNRLSSHYRWF